MVRVGATGGASKARMPEMNAQRFCRTQSQQSVHKEARTLCGARDYCLFARVVGMERFGAAIPPVVARIFSGDSTSPLTREARTWCGARDGCSFKKAVGMVRVGATGGASKARMPEMNAQRFCRTQSQQSVHKEARTLCGARDYCLFARVVGMERFGAAIPPVVARIFSGDSTSPLTREARMLV